MASVNTSDIPEEQQFMSELWMLRKKYYHGEDNEQYWTDLIDEFVAVSKRHNRNGYYDQLLLVCIDDIERRWKTATGNPFIDKDPLKTVYERLKKQ